MISGLKSNNQINNCTLEYCDHGIIIDLVEKIERDDNEIDHYAIVDVNNTQLRIKVPPHIYSTLQIGEEVTLYATSTKYKLLLTKRV